MKTSSNQSLDSKVQTTAAATMKKIREAAGQGNWLSRLSDKRLAETYHRLRMGQSARHVARVAKEMWGVMPNSSPASLSRTVNKFKKEVLGDLDENQATNDDTKEELKKLLASEKKLSGKLDLMERMRWVIQVQTNRVHSYYMKEKDFPLPQKIGDNMIKVLGDLVGMGLRLEMDLGIRDQKPSEFNLLVKHRFDGLMSGTMADGGNAVIAAADKFLQLAEESALTLEEAKDGSYSMRPDTDGEDEE